jgi:hypothetical protein
MIDWLTKQLSKKELLVNNSKEENQITTKRTRLDRESTNHYIRKNSLYCDD